MKEAGVADEAASRFASVDLSRFDFNRLNPGQGNHMDPGLLDHIFQLLGWPFAVFPGAEILAGNIPRAADFL